MSTTTERTAADPLAALDEIRQREQAATPGPWRWRGNMDNGDPYLTSAGYRHYTRADGLKVTTHAGDVLGHIAHEFTPAEARRRGVGDPDFLSFEVPEEPAATYDRRYDEALKAAQEQAITDWLAGEYGEPRREQRMAFCTDWIYTEARKLAVYEVAPTATDREDRRVYRADVTGIRHPDAEFIAASRDDVRRLLRVVEAVRDLCRDTDGNWLEPSSSLPAGEFQAALALLSEPAP